MQRVLIQRPAEAVIDPYWTLVNDGLFRDLVNDGLFRDLDRDKIVLGFGYWAYKPRLLEQLQQLRRSPSRQ